MVLIFWRKIINYIYSSVGTFSNENKLHNYISSRFVDNVVQQIRYSTIIIMQFSAIYHPSSQLELFDLTRVKINIIL